MGCLASQGGELAVPFADTRDALEENFRTAHRTLYGFVLDAPVELVTLRVEATGLAQASGLARFSATIADATVLSMNKSMRKAKLAEVFNHFLEKQHNKVLACKMPLATGLSRSKPTL